MSFSLLSDHCQGAIEGFHPIMMLVVATQFLTHVLINFQKNSKIAKNIENPKNTFLIYLHRF